MRPSARAKRRGAPTKLVFRSRYGTAMSRDTLERRLAAA